MEENCSETRSGNAEADVESKPTLDDIDIQGSGDVGKVSPNERPESPDSNCAICLGKLENKSFTDGCLHQFCFTCLLEWSKVKAECPLCKQRFESIIHNVRSIEDYDQYHLRPPTPAAPLNTIIPQFEIDVMPRFRYRTTLLAPPQLHVPHAHAHAHSHSHGQPHVVPHHQTPGVFHRLERFEGLYIPPEYHFPTQLQHMRMPVSAWQTRIIGHRAFWRVPRRLYIDISDVNRSRSGQALIGGNSDIRGTIGFRRHVYNSSIWARREPDITGRYRDCNPRFLAQNPAQLHRFVPWLNRELNVLLNNHDDFVEYLVSVVVACLQRFCIRSSQFRNVLEPVLGPRTDHFLYELFAFGTSAYDMVGYDRAVTYGALVDLGDNTSSEDVVYYVDSDHSSQSDDVLIVDEVVVPRRGITGMHSNGITSAPSNLHMDPSQVTLDSDTNTSDSESECVFVGSVKPRHLRTPEIITLDDDSESQEQEVEEQIQSRSRSRSKASVEDHIETRPKIGLRLARIHGSDQSSRKWCVTNDHNVPSTSSGRHEGSALRMYASQFQWGSQTSSSSHNDSSGEEWNKRKPAKKSHKREKRKRKSSTSEKKSRDKGSKRKKVRKEKEKEKKRKPEKHWKKKLCKKLETSSSSSSDEEIFLSRSSKRKSRIVSSDSSSEHSQSNLEARRSYSYSHNFVSPQVRRKASTTTTSKTNAGHTSRLKSVVHVKRNRNSRSSASASEHIGGSSFRPLNLHNDIKVNEGTCGHPTNAINCQLGRNVISSSRHPSLSPSSSSTSSTRRMFIVEKSDI